MTCALDYGAGSEGLRFIQFDQRMSDREGDPGKAGRVRLRLRWFALQPAKRKKDSFILFPEFRHKKPVGNVVFDTI